MANLAVQYGVQTTSITEYMASLEKSGVRVLQGTPGTFWTRHESGAMMRRPTFHLEPPAPREVRQILLHGRAAMASYLLSPDEQHPANAWLYLCTDQSYALEKLAPVARRNIRRGLKELRIAPLSSHQLLAHGVQAFCDTRRRVGLSDGTPEEFRRQFTNHTSLPGHVYLGAWKDDQLAAFLTITEIDDWAELGCYSMDTLLHYRPNDTLLYSVLTHYLVECKYRLVSYGLSSIQAESNASGLHKFKMKMGFEARPVHRAFVVHPLLRLFTNRLMLRGINAALRIRPRDRRLRKAGGALAYMLGDVQMLETPLNSKDDE